MALTVRSNGSGPSNIVSSSWWNDYYNLLTGAMTDQPVTLNHLGGGITLTVKCDASTTPLKVFQGDGVSTALLIDHSGNATVGGTLAVGGGISGPVGGGVPTTRNGGALSVPIYTGTTSPVSPPTGSIWVDA